jgi:CheY-like chemotaxis protein
MSQKQALVVDDEPDITTYLATLLSDNCWQVRTANSAAEGLALAEEQAPDVVLLDLMMPERGGLSTFVALRKGEGTENVPVVLVTGIQDTLTEDFEAYRGRFKHYHPDAYIQKPIDTDLLPSTLAEVTAS